MDDEALARSAPELVSAGWQRPVVAATPLGGGMNSATALIDLGDARAVLKWVPIAAAGALEAGCRIAYRLAGHGLATGAPIPTRTGELTHHTPDGCVALLDFVAGDPLSGHDPEDQRDLAVTLAAVHASEAAVRSGVFLGDEIAGMVHDVEPWIRPSVALVFEEYRRLPPLTWGVLHADPAPEAFLREPSTGRVALIDWSAATYGPVLYDVASALMYLGGRASAAVFWDTYLDRSPSPRAELLEHLGAFQRYRAAVQAAYFSMRIGTEDRTGIGDDDENWKGLRDAEQMLRDHGGLVGDV